MSIKLVAIDIDGTLLNSNKELTAKTKATIAEAKAQGIKIVLATGRPYPGVVESLKALNLEEAGDYVITYNGSLVQASDTKAIIASHGLTYENFIEIEAMARQVGVPIHTIDQENIYTANHLISPYTIHEVGLTGMPLYYRSIDRMTPDMEIIKMMMIDEPVLLDEAITKIPDWFKEKYTTAKSAEFYYEILNIEANKGKALLELADHLGIKQEETMAIGDNENDLPMVVTAGIGVAMGNAVPALKAVADVIGLSNDEDGVAGIIEEYILK